MSRYTILYCPKCNNNAWQKLGGYRGIPITYSCMTCGLGFEQAQRIGTALRAAEGEKHSEEA